MHRDAELERLANGGRFDAGTNPTPERRVEQDDVDGWLQHVRRELLEVHDHCVRREWHAQLLTREPHSVHAEHRIFEIVVVQILDVLAKPNRLFGRPDTVWIEPKSIAWQSGGDGAITLELELRREDAAFELVRRKSITRLERKRFGDQLIAGAHLARRVLGARIAVKQI